MNKEVILELQKAFEELLTKAESKSYTEPECDCTAGLQSDTCDESEEFLTPIEDCITTFLNKCTEEGRLPTLDEAKVIVVLDQVNSKYN